MKTLRTALFGLILVVLAILNSVIALKIAIYLCGLIGLGLGFAFMMVMAYLCLLAVLFALYVDLD